MYHNNVFSVGLCASFEWNWWCPGVVVGQKNNNGVGCLNTLMNSLNEDISVKKLRETKLESLRNRQSVKQPAPRPLSIRRDRLDLIQRNAKGPSHNALRGRMWSFVNTFGSHSLHTKLKTHYSEQLHSYNNLLLNLVHNEHLPQVDVQIHIMVVLRNTDWWVISI